MAQREDREDGIKPESLICFTNGNELHIAISALILKPAGALYVVPGPGESDFLNGIDELLGDKKLSCKLELRSGDELIECVRKHVGNETREPQAEGQNGGRRLKTAVLVNECEGMEQFAVLMAAASGGAPLFYCDTAEGQVYCLGGLMPKSIGKPGEQSTKNWLEEGLAGLKDLKPVEGGPVELRVEEILEVSGFSVEHSAEELMKSPSVGHMLAYITEDPKRWQEIRKSIKNNHETHGDWIYFGMKHRVSHGEASPLKHFTDFLEKREYLKEKIITSNRVMLKIPDPYIRSFIQITGLWLEALTYRMIYELPFIDDIKADVRFLWGDPPCAVENEIDVMAAADSRLILVSCKDVDSFSTNMLNELEVYSRRVAGSKAVRILVTAKKPGGPHMYQRAEAMNIRIIWYNTDPEGFSGKIKKVLEEELKK